MGQSAEIKDGGGGLTLRWIANIMTNAFRIAVQHALTVFNMVDGRLDEYEDESGIDVGASINEDYDAVNDLYEAAFGGNDANVALLLH